ncbi:MAG: DNA polymerase III subunit gamma/tau [Hyphomonadaceae bacterium]
MSDDSGADSGPSLFGDEASPAGYVVLARKYRPRTFEDMIGQEAMVKTIANSFALGRVPHAYMLTGVRGVGKTTTARLLARALNYKRGEIDAPSIALEPPGEHCLAIMESRHPDVFEMDAASRTGINDIREILESVRYAPVSARTKVYIIDEVHMLSTAAFNGLLKTLEEPPPHVKFIFATTEIRKVPVTVLSRTQRFDLKRISPQALGEHLANICAKEKVAIAPEGLALIARAAEGSVRDALSLLDQAIVQTGGGKPVDAAAIRDMLGLADRARLIDLFAAIARGDAKTALTEMRDQYDRGADPALILRDLLEIGHEAARVQALGQDVGAAGADWAAKIRALAESQSPAQLSRLWAMLLKALEDVGKAPEPIAAAEMAAVRLAAAAGLPPPEDAAKLLAASASSAPAAPPPARPAAPPENATIQTGPAGPGLQSFDDVASLIAEMRDINLEVDVDRFMRVTSFAPGRIVYAPIAGAPHDLALRLSRALHEWTGETWEVRPDGAPEEAAGVESLAERRTREREAVLEELRKHPFVADALKAFPNAQIVEVRAATPPEGAEIIDMDSRTPPGPAKRKKEG